MRFLTQFQLNKTHTRISLSTQKREDTLGPCVQPDWGSSLGYLSKPNHLENLVPDGSVQNNAKSHMDGILSASKIKSFSP